MEPVITTRRRWAQGAAIAVGALAGCLGVLLGSLRSTDAAVYGPGTTTTTSPPGPQWFHPAEVVLGPAALVPETLRVEGDELALRYRLEPIAPSAVGPDVAVDTAVLPDRWTLVTPLGEITASTEPWTRLVSFRLPRGILVDEVSLRLDGYWIRSPFWASIVLDPANTPVAEVAPGIALEIVRTIPGGAGSQVVTALSAEHAFTLSELTVEGVGGSWMTSSIDQMGTGRWTLSYSTAEPPTPLPLVVRGVIWVLVEKAAVVDLGEVPRG
jgi:hypothetical protein